MMIPATVFPPPTLVPSPKFLSILPNASLTIKSLRSEAVNAATEEIFISGFCVVYRVEAQECVDGNS